jgi:hypothetical protein
VCNIRPLLFARSPDTGHFERSRPIFSSRFARAKRSACAERNLSYAPTLCFITFGRAIDERRPLACRCREGIEQMKSRWRQSILSAMLTSMPEWIKTLIIALVSSFFTVCLVEPVKAAIQRRMRKREVRRSLYQEMAINYGKLLAQVEMANHDPEMRNGIDERFAMGFKKFSFELAQRDPATYYSLGYYELYWIELLYAGMEHIIKGKFIDEEQHLRAAGYTAHSFLVDVKNRNLSRGLVFRVSPDWLRKHLRERLPEIAYTDAKPPSLIERARRRFDQKASMSAERIHYQKKK